MESVRLLQLGTDLERASSNTQAEEFTAPRTDVDRFDNRKDRFLTRDGIQYAGTHLIVDLWGAKRIDDLRHVEDTLKQCVERAKATLLHLHLHHFTPNDGISGVAVLAESHISIHSWPERDYAALDIFMCGVSAPYEAVTVLEENFAPDRVVIHEHLRGRDRQEARSPPAEGGNRRRFVSRDR